MNTVCQPHSLMFLVHKVSLDYRGLESNRNPSRSNRSSIYRILVHKPLDNIALPSV